MTFLIRLNGYEKALLGFSLLRKSVGNEVLSKAALAGAMVMHEVIVPMAPYVSGSYRRSIDFTLKPTKRKNYAEAMVYTNDERGPYIEFGTGSKSEFGGSWYTIRARRVRFLKFIPTGHTHYVYRRWVRHPGRKPHPHFRPGFKRATPKAIQAIEDTARAAIKSIRVF